MEPEQHSNPLEKVGNLVSKTVNESRLPTTEYQSTVGIYGGKLINDGDKLVYDISGPTSNLNRWGDPKLRIHDEHILRSSKLALLRKHPSWFFHLLNPGPKRYRGNLQEMMSNVTRLGLEEYYGEHPKGIEIKQPEIFTGGIALQDIWKAADIKSPKLDTINRFDALARATQYIATIHRDHGPIGELLVSDILFQDKNEDGQVINPVLNIPDIVYNPDKKFGPEEQKATDLL
jgi:hypothetical protein